MLNKYKFLELFSHGFLWFLITLKVRLVDLPKIFEFEWK